MISVGVPEPIAQALPAGIPDLHDLCSISEARGEGCVASRGGWEAGGIVPGGEADGLEHRWIRLDYYHGVVILTLLAR